MAKHLYRFLRWLLSLEAFILCFGGTEVVVSLWQKGLGEVYRTLAGFVLVYLIIMGVLAGLTAWQMGRAGRLARRLGLLTSALNLAVVPLGTVLGVLGLVLFARSSAHDSLQRSRAHVHQPVAGDGTGTTTMALFYALQWGSVIAGLRWSEWWARQQGLTHADSPLPWYAEFVLAIFLSVLFHELGHAAGAWASQFEIAGIRIGPLDWLYLEGRWRFRFVAGGILGGGQVAAIPTRPAGIHSGALFMTAAGPVASFVLGSVTLVLLLMAPAAPWKAWWTLLTLVALFSASDFILNLVPIGTLNGYSDGARLWQLALRGPWSDHLVFSYYRGLSRTTMLAPADWPSNLVEAAARFPSIPIDRANNLLMAYAHFRQKGDLEKAFHYYRALHEVVPELPRDVTEHWMAEFAFYEAVYVNNAAEARRLLDQVTDRTVSDYWRASAAVLASEVRLEEAREAWKKGWSMAAAAPMSGLRTLDELDFRMIAERWFPDLAALCTAVNASELRMPAPVGDAVR